MMLPKRVCHRRAPAWDHKRDTSIWRRCGVGTWGPRGGRRGTEAVTVTGYHRKALIRAWRRPKARRARGPRRGRPTRYDAAVVRTLRAIWEAAGYPWSRRLQALLPMWLPWARRRLAVSPATEAQVRAISPRQMDRLLAPDKRTATLYGRTKPPVSLGCHEPGFTEVDLVSHSGDRAGLPAVAECHRHPHDVGRDLRGQGKSQVRVQEALEHLRQALPFALRGIDSDNGSEFINAHLYRYCRTHQLQFTRGRPYKKDDNAHIEQKNWTHVRKLMGYVRYAGGGAGIDCMGFPLTICAVCASPPKSSLSRRLRSDAPKPRLPPRPCPSRTGLDDAPLGKLTPPGGLALGIESGRARVEIALPFLNRDRGIE